MSLKGDPMHMCMLQDGNALGKILDRSDLNLSHLAVHEPKCSRKTSYMLTSTAHIHHRLKRSILSLSTSPRGIRQ